MAVIKIKPDKMHCKWFIINCSEYTNEYTIVYSLASFVKHEHYTVYLTGGHTTLLTKITAAQNEVALSYHRPRGLYFLAAVFAAAINI